ncbi:beta-tubulin [Naegleria gruberi]|uniref:Beta-tubulin n=1 Tax=Naegleria gruberi TaxID=5762 RepID=D2VRJ5_NAEGR|nr:beta-tubulin [Naegleria gruberi]EFC40613.1 beta-tubulin [Naegleria gruberi]|eukprot:XP_002673357.1 beta-tubulin [Naegleria gruberi]
MPKPIEATQTPPTAASTIEAKLSSQSTNKILDELYRGLNIFYDEGANGQYVPRTIMADLDHSSLDSIMSNQEIGKWFRPDYSLGSTGSSGNNWAKGYYTEGPELAELVMDVVRKSAESCDCIQGFQIFHSIGGGCGSGMGCFITNRLQDEYGGAMIMTNSVFPSTKTVDSVLAPYNSVLTLHHLIENVQMVNCFDNHALNQISQKLFRIESPEMVDLNEIVAQSVTGITSSFRFSGIINSDLRKMATNLVPFPRAHFFMNSLSPLGSSFDNSDLKVEQITSQLFNPNHFLVDANPKNGKYLTASVIFRGDVSSSSAEEQVNGILQRDSSYFYKSIPNNLQTSICKVAPPGIKRTGTLIANSTSILTIFRQLSSSFSMLFKRKAFMKSFEIEGMDELEFSEAISNLNDLIAEYELQEYEQDNHINVDDEELGGGESEHVE